jgi:YVTN family beta-propeller protein
MLRRLSLLALTCLLPGLSVQACGTAAQIVTEEEPPSTDPIEPINYDALYVVNGGDSSISVINTETLKVQATIRINHAQYPHHVYLNKDRSRMAVAVPGHDLSGGHVAHSHATGSGPPGAVLILDALTGRTLTSRRLPGPNHNAVFSPDETEVWTAQQDGHVMILDPLTMAIKRSVAVGDGPSEVTFDVDGSHAFIANTASNSITVMDPVSKKVVSTLSVGGSPVGAWQGSNGLAYVDNEADGTISVIDTRAVRVLQTEQLGFTPGMLAFGPDGNVWVADSYNAKVALRNARADVVVATASAGQGAHGVVFNGDGKTSYVSNQDADTVSVIDISSRQTIVGIPVGHKPNGMVWRPKQ